MKDISPSDLKTILHSKRANLYYLEHCRVLVNGGRVEYVTDQGKESLYWNIPIANTTVVMLGTGTSVTQAAMREFAKAGVLVGFCGGGGTPLFAVNEVEVAVSWLCSQSEYRPTEYLQSWVGFWFDERKRLQAAVDFQQIRIGQIRKSWNSFRQQRNSIFNVEPSALEAVLQRFSEEILRCETTNAVMIQEAVLTKALYRLAGNAVSYGEFSRTKNGEGVDAANRFLDHGNYLTYGLAATACWVLGLPHGLSVLHGKTRRGGLVFDVADLVKDALILPNAFIAAMAGEDEKEFRHRVVNHFAQFAALDCMIDSIQQVSASMDRGEQ